MKTAEQRFWAKVTIPSIERTSDGCWLWIGGKTSFGHGRFCFSRGNLMPAHKYMWELVNGSIVTGLQVLHRCDVPACVRPSHLFLGTQADNICDMIQKHRKASQSGENNSSARLTPDDVREIRALYTPGRGVSALAGKYGVHPVTIRQIAKRERWGRVE